MLNRKTRLLLYGNNLWVLGEGLLGPLFAVFAQKIGGDILDVSWAWAVYLIVTGVFVIIAGKISDKLSKEKIMVCGYALAAVFTFGYLVVSSPLQLILIEAGLGVAVAMANPTWLALYHRYTDSSRTGFFWGLFDGQKKIVTGIAVIFGGLIVTYLSFRILFLTMGTSGHSDLISSADSASQKIAEYFLCILNMG